MNLEEIAPSSSERVAGITVAGAEAVIVVADVTPDGVATIQADDTWTLQAGARPQAYSVMYHRTRSRAEGSAAMVEPRPSSASLSRLPELME